MEQRWAQWMFHSAYVWCCVPYTGRNSNFNDCRLDAGCGASVCYCSISKAGCIPGLKEGKIWPTLVVVFKKLCLSSSRYHYENLSGFNTTILRHLPVIVVNIILFCPCVHLLKSQITQVVCCYCNLSCFSDVPWYAHFDRLGIWTPNLLQSGILW